MRTVLPSASTTLRSLTSGAHKLVVLSNSHAGAPSAAAPSGTEESTSADGGSKARCESKQFLLSRLENVVFVSLEKVVSCRFTFRV